jgi:hypothetical protein
MKNLYSQNHIEKLEYELLPIAVINLSSDQITRAAKISEQISNLSRRWQTYINNLALDAFVEWLQERADNLKINQNGCTVLNPALANAIPVVANLQVDKFRICLIPIGILDLDTVTVPQVVIDIPEYIPHFYVLVQVLEEQGSAIISGFLSYQELMTNRGETNLHPGTDWTYELSVSWFDSEPNNLLLYLRCLKPQAITLPTVPQNRHQILLTMESELSALLPHLQSPQRELWEVLTWEQGTAVLTHSDLLQWIYNSQKQTPDSVHKTNWKDLFKLCTQPAVNVGRWLWDELDELAQQISWNLLPTLTPAIVMRSPTEELQVIIQQLQNQGLEIPSQARGAYKDFILAGISLRLYAITWYLLSDTDAHLWSLLLILGTTSESTLPRDLKLRVSDKNSVLLEKGINQQQGNAYLFTRLIGHWDEKFLVSVILMDGVEVNLPPFTFHLSNLA